MDQAPQNGKNVLIIEDEQFISDLYVRALTSSGYAVTVINDGNQALEAIKTNTFDLILLDIMLPNVTGTEILLQLRDPLQVPNLKAKVIIITNLEVDEEGRKTLESHADGYIIKAEVTPKELVAFLDQLQLNS